MPAPIPAYYVAFFGMPGCLSDSHIGPIECHNRRDLVEFVNDALREYDYSGRARRQVNLRMAWRHVQKRGCDSLASFVVENTQPGALDRIEFRALSRDEFDAMEKESDLLP